MTAPAPLALTLGDPAGIGPEIVAAAWARRETEELPPFFVVSGPGLVEVAGRRVGIELPTVHIDDPSEAQAAFRHGLPLMGRIGHDYRPGEPDDSGARYAFESLQLGLQLLDQDRATGLVTGPVAKAAIARIARDFVGQTEECAKACGMAPEDAVMMLAGPSLRTVPITVHCALADVPGLLSTELIVRRSLIVHRAMQRDFAIAEPRLAIVGLNPHAGEEGRMGCEEAGIIAPAIAALQAEGIDATGPHPADTIFAPRKRSDYDVAIAMYHDQALIPLKTLDFDQGVNVTLGLPIIRTSPDHGTAFDIAGKGVARPDAMIAAIRMAGEMASRRA